MLEAKELTCVLGNRTLFKDLDLHVQRGALCFILGPNGAGKTTLIQSLLELRKSQHGTIHWDGRKASDELPADRAKRVGYWKREDKVSLALRTQEYVSLGDLSKRGWWIPQTHWLKIQAKMAFAGCDHLWDRDVDSLSDGEWQLVQFARFLSQDPHYLLADEPSAHLDLIQKRSLYTKLKDWAQKYDKGLLIITHDLDQAIAHADCTWILDGKGGCVLVQDRNQLSETIAEIFG